MKERFYLYRRRQTFYVQDSRTGKQQSLDTKERKTALRLLEIKRQAADSPSPAWLIACTRTLFRTTVSGPRAYDCSCCSPAVGTSAEAKEAHCAPAGPSTETPSTHCVPAATGRGALRPRRPAVRRAAFCLREPVSTPLETQ